MSVTRWETQQPVHEKYFCVSANSKQEKYTETLNTDICALTFWELQMSFDVLKSFFYRRVSTVSGHRPHLLLPGCSLTSPAPSLRPISVHDPRHWPVKGGKTQTEPLTCNKRSDCSAAADAQKAPPKAEGKTYSSETHHQVVRQT